jgi:hypothetical protein
MASERAVLVPHNLVCPTPPPLESLLQPRFFGPKGSAAQDGLLAVIVTSEGWTLSHCRGTRIQAALTAGGMQVHIPLDRLPELLGELVYVDTDYGSGTPDALRDRCRAGRRDLEGCEAGRPSCRLCRARAR